MAAPGSRVTSRFMAIPSCKVTTQSRAYSGAIERLRPARNSARIAIRRSTLTLEEIMRRYVSTLIIVLAAGVALAARQTSKPAPSTTGHAGHEAPAKTSRMSTAAKIKMALSAGPADITRNAAVVEPGENGQMKQLRAGTNGWVCMVQPETMCLDKEWQGWADAFMTKKDPQIKAVGIGYMLRGDNGASNTDPFATGPTADNQWVVSPAHIMVLTPDTKQLDALPTDWKNGGPWVMWKGTKYAHIMVPTTAMSKAAPASARKK